LHLDSGTIAKFQCERGGWGTNSNLLPWPVSTRSITACFNSHKTVAIEEWGRVRNCEVQPNTNSFIEADRNYFVVSGFNG
jgi:hypothetical protein